MARSTSAKKHLKTTLLVPELRRKYYAQTVADSQAGKKVAWCSNNIPSEILEAMEITAVYLENYATVCASKRLSSAFCRAGDHNVLRVGIKKDKLKSLQTGQMPHIVVELISVRQSLANCPF